MANLFPWLPEGALAVANHAARQAGQLLLEHLDQAREVRVKGERDIVTDADLAAQNTIIGLIHDRFPDHDVLAEEADPQRERRSDYLWVVDPLDGTTNYSRRYPMFSVSIALAYQEQIILGLVYDPQRDQLFSAVQGQGAHLNGVPLRVSQTARLAEAVVGTDWARRQGLRERSTALVAAIAPQVVTVRCSGSAALSLCHLGAGWLDLYFHLALNPWDVAAGGLIIEEAGGRVTTLAGGPWTIFDESYLASNGRLHQEARRVVQLAEQIADSR